MNIQHCLSVLYAHTALFVMQYALYSIVKFFDPPMQHTIYTIVLQHQLLKVT